MQYLDSQLKDDAGPGGRGLECSEPSWKPRHGERRRRSPSQKEPKITGVVAAGTVRVGPALRRGDGCRNGYRGGWHVVTPTPTGGAKFVRLKHARRRQPLVLDDVADATAPASPRVKAAASKPNVAPSPAAASGGGRRTRTRRCGASANAAIPETSGT